MIGQFIILKPAAALRVTFAFAFLAAILLAGCGRADHPTPTPTPVADATPPPLRPMDAVRLEGNAEGMIAQEATISPGPTRRVRFTYAGADCGSCAPTLARTLGRLPGMHEVRCSWKVPEAIVDFNPTQLTERQISGAIAGMGLRPREEGVGVSE